VSDAHDSDFAFEVLQSGNLTVAATVLPVRADVFRVRTWSDWETRRAQRNGDGNLASASLSAILRGRLRSGEVICSALIFAFLCDLAPLRELFLR